MRILDFLFACLFLYCLLQLKVIGYQNQYFTSRIELQKQRADVLEQAIKRICPECQTRP